MRKVCKKNKVSLSIAIFLGSFFCIVHGEPSSHFLSFIMPAYNCAKTIVESLDSIYRQNLDIPFEIVCTNDASTDDTYAILLGYQNNHPELKIYSHRENRGGGAARNTCVSHAQGDLIFCLDSDNVLVPDSVKKLVELLDISGCDGAAFEEIRFFVAYSQTTDQFKKRMTDRFNMVFPDNAKIRTHLWVFKAPDNISDITHILQTYINPTASGNYLYTKESYKRAEGYPENRGALDTMAFGLRQCATGSRIAILPHSFYWHRFSNDSYWTREARAGKNDYYAVFKEFPELFLPESYEYLLFCEQSKYDFSQELMKNSFKPISQQALQHLFSAYKYEYAGKWSEAIEEYSQAIILGGTHEKIKRRLAHAQLQAKGKEEL